MPGFADEQNGGPGFAVREFIDLWLKAISDKDKETKIEEIDPEDVEAIGIRFDELKKYIPYIAVIGLAVAWKHFKKNGLDKSIDTVALSNVIAGFTPLITAFAWYMLTTVNATAKNLSYVIAAAETVPTLDLNLPPGINLGSYFVAVDEMIPLVGRAAEMLQQAGEKFEATPWYYYLAPGMQGVAVNKLLRDLLG